MPPTTEPLMIVSNGRDITGYVPVDSLQISNERPPQISTARFTVENGGALGLGVWKALVICSPDLASTYFLGYISRLNARKSGIFIDYDVECSSLEVRLQKAVVNGVFSGTDAEILAALLAGTYPDLSGLFDFATDVTAISASDLTLDANNLDLMGALDALADMTGAEWAFPTEGAMRVNYFRNPALTNDMEHYGGTIPANSTTYTLYGGVWVPGNASWGSAVGQNGGGIQLQSVTDAGYYRAFLRVGRDSESDTFKLQFKREPDDGDHFWLCFSCYVKTSVGTANASLEWLVYDLEGNFIDNHGFPSMGTANSSTWTKVRSEFDLSSADYPEQFYIEYVIRFTSTVGAYTVYLDEFLLERLQAAVQPTTGTYFDGGTSGAMWSGIANDSASYMGAAKKKLDWGTTPPNAAFDVDIGTSNEIISDLEFDYPAIDAINTVIVIGGAKYTEVVWEYPANNQQTHFDLEETVYAAAGAAYPVIAVNIGSDVYPNWSNLTVGDYDSDTFTGGITVLYDKEDHWLYFQTAPPDLKRAFRVTGRIKQRIRATVQDENDVADTGITTVDTIYNEAVTSEDEAFALGQAELDNRSAPTAMRFTTYEPGLLPGAEIDITDTSQGLSETMIIQRVQRKYLGGGYATFEVECGKREPGLDDVLAETHSLAEPKPPITANEIAATLQTLYDDDSNPLWDDDYQYVYQSV